MDLADWVGPSLAILALILISPGPRWVRRWTFLDRVPRPAIVLWQAGTVAALVATIGAAAVITVTLLTGPPNSLGWLILSIGLGLFALSVVARLGWSLIVVARETGRRRARYRAAVDLLGEAAADGQLRVLAQAAPVAYCLPGLRESRVVVSQGTLDTLAPDEVAAVLAHEWAHLRARHDVVLDFFTALHRAFPLWARSDIALSEGRELIEMLADDTARRQVGAPSLARALVALASSKPPRSALGAGGAVLRRVRRLERQQSHRGLAVLVYLLAATLVALPVGVIIGGQL